VNSLVNFAANTPAKAGEVNANFTAVKTAVDDNQAQIAALRAEVNALKAQLTNITSLNNYISLQTVNGQPTVRVSAANLQIVNGMNKTDSINGAGNLIVGYDEADGQLSLPSGFSLTLSDRPKTGSHNLVIGPAHAYVGAGGIVSGFGNTITEPYSVAIGGAANDATAPLSVVLGGIANYTGGEASTISGGRGNYASGRQSVISGGFGNAASGAVSAVVGGANNAATAQYSVVGGGASNIADDDYGVVSGGYQRFTNQTYDWVGGPYNGK